MTINKAQGQTFEKIGINLKREVFNHDIQLAMANRTLKHNKYLIFLLSGPKVPLSFPAPDRECCIFGLTRQKNRILTMGANKECLRWHVCHPRLRLG